MRRVLSWKRFLIVVGIAVALSAAGFGIHAAQTRRQATDLRDRAEKAQRDGNTADAASLYAQYLRFRPKDEPAHQQYATLMFTRAAADPAANDKAADAAENFLRHFPAHVEERKKLVELYLKAGRLKNARQHIDILFDKYNQGTDPDLLDKAATCEVALGGDTGQAVTFLDKAIQTGKAPPRTVERLLGMLHGPRAYRDPRYKPEDYITTLTEKEPYRSSIEARVVAVRFFILTKQFEYARDHISKALAMPGGATNSDALLAMAELDIAEMKTPEQIRPQLEKAERHLQAAFKADPKNVKVGLVLSQVLHDLGRNREAVDVLRSAADALGETNDEFVMVVDHLIDLGEQDVSARLVAKVEASAADKDRLTKYFRGRLATLKKDWVTARVNLEEVAPALVRTRDLHKRAMYGLGLCQEVLHNPDKQLEYYAAALADDPRYYPAVVGHAEALFRLGKYREALPEFKTLVAGWGQARFRPQLARLELRAALTQPPAARSWAAFEQSLGPVADRTPELQIMYAESLLARNETEKAAAVLEEVIQKDPRNEAAWLALGRVTAGGQPGRMLEKLDAAEKQIGDTASLRLARAIVLVNRTKKPTPGDFKRLAADADKFETADRKRLWVGLGESASRAARITADPDAAALRNLAIEFYLKAAELDPTDLLARATLVDLGMAAGRRDVVDAAVAGIEAAEGKDGPYGALARVVVRYPAVEKMEDKVARPAAIAELRELANRAKAARPNWGRVYVVLAQLDDSDGRKDSALANYREAIDKGERSEAVIRRAVELLRDRRQDDQAAALLNSLHTEVPLPEDLERFRAIKELIAHDIPRNERPTIERVAPAGAKDWRIQLLRGSLLVAIGEDKDAETAFREAVALGDNVPEAWGSLVAHLVRVGQLDEAKRATQQGEERLKNNPPAGDAARAELIDTLAGCYELVGDRKTALARYQDAVKAAPRELNPLKHLVLFLQRSGSTAEAMDLLRKLTDDPAQDKARWARRHLALTLLAGRDAYAQRGAALRLIEKNLVVTQDDEDKKARAVVLTADPATRDEGIKTLQDFAKWNDLTPDEFFLLGRLTFDQGKVAESVEFFEKAARPRPGLSAEHLAGLIRVNLGLNRTAQARTVLGRLKAFAPGGWEPVREEARILRREAAAAERNGDTDTAKRLTDQARDLVLKFPGTLTDPGVRRRSAILLEELGIASAAEELYARNLAEGKEPTAHVPLAAFLVGQRRSVEAIALARKYEANAPVSITARILTGAVRANSPGPVVEREVAAWLDEKLAQATGRRDQLVLLGAKAELFDATARYDEAIRTYEAAIAAARAAKPEELGELSDDPFVNNLCMTLVLHRPDRAAEAVDRMRKVIDVRGPVPAYLDTLAVGYIVQGGHTEEAEKALTLALVQQRRAAYLFHLGWAYDLNPSKRVFREKWLEEAKQLGLTAADLHPLEARKFAELYGSGK